MNSPRRAETLSAEDLELLALYDGTEHIEALPSARMVMVAPASVADDPVAVTIEWGSGTVQRPLPGSALWRAVLVRSLDDPERGDPASEIVRSQIRRSLERFPDLESWWHWVRTGWTAPPSTVESLRRRG